MLAWVGAGKTAAALSAINGRFLVVAPLRVATHVWPVEARKWAPHLRVSLAIGSPRQRLKALGEGDLVVINYENLHWLIDQKYEFDGVIFDELTRLKNPGSRVSKAAAKLKADIRWGLTGSFTSNGLEDVFGQCKAVSTGLLGRSKGAFLQQYFTSVKRPTHTEWTPKGGALDAVMQRIKPYTFVLEPGEYRDKLPPCHVVDQVCTMDMTDYEQMKKQFMVQFPDTTAVAMNAAIVTSKLQQLASGFIYTDKGAKYTSGHKFELLDEILEGNQRANTIVVYQYQAELEALKLTYPHARGIEAVDDWNAGKVPMLLVHPKSAGHGLNLQHGGCHMIFLSLPWSLELYEQTIGRLHRSGQTKEVWVYRLITHNTVDERILGALRDRRSLADLAVEALA
jgi:SNF2 family DNA or RNA helicase